MSIRKAARLMWAHNVGYLATDMSMEQYANKKSIVYTGDIPHQTRLG